MQLADRVAMLRDGVIAAVGTHRELLATNPEYRALLESYGYHVDTIRHPHYPVGSTLWKSHGWLRARQ